MCVYMSVCVCLCVCVRVCVSVCACTITNLSPQCGDLAPLPVPPSVSGSVPTVGSYEFQSSSFNLQPASTKFIVVVTVCVTRRRGKKENG